MATSKSGTTSASEVWTKTGSPYTIDGDFIIDTAHTVDVKPGVEILYQGNYSIDVKGRLHVGGTARDRVVIRQEHHEVPDPGFSSNHAIKDSFDTGYIILNYADILGMYVGLQALSSRLFLNHCRVANCLTGMGPFNGFNGKQIVHTIFEDCGTGIDITSMAAPGSVGDDVFWKCIVRRCVVGVSIGSGPGFESIFKHSHVYDCRLAGIQLSSADGTISINDVWWGSDAGPTYAPNVGGDGETLDPTSFAGTLVYTPFTNLSRYVPKTDTFRTFLGGAARQLNGQGQPVDIGFLLDEDLDEILDRADWKVDGLVLGEGPALPKKLFGYGTETEEKHRYQRGSRYALLYPEVRAITTVERRTGLSTWTTVSENEDSGWFAGEEDRTLGVLWFRGWISKKRDALRVTYDHGYSKPPKAIEDVALRVAAIDTLPKLLLPNKSGKVMDAHLERLQAEVDAWIVEHKARRRGRQVTVVFRG